MGKIVSKQEFKTKIGPEIRRKGKKIALCHGVFDLVHPGHIIHLEQAKQMADILVVSITAAEFVRKGPDRPYFNDEMRMRVLAALECVDYVILSEGYTVDDIVESVEPDIYVKGEEYKQESEDITGKISEERKLVEQHGGKIKYTSGQVYSSTKLINKALSGLSDDVIKYIEYFITKYSMEDIKGYAKKAEELKILVIGDVIIDKYSYCSVQGLMSKDMGYSARLKYSEEYLGGAVAVARHLGSFGKNVTLMSMIGDENKWEEKLNDALSDKIQLQLIVSKEFPTITKHRYLERDHKREEYRKIFAIDNIPETAGYGKEEKEAFTQQLKKHIAEYDTVFLCDFGHGLVDDDVKNIVQEKAKFLILNCQTNSANQGMNIITKYNRADLFSLDQRELKLAFPMLADNEKKALKEMGSHLKGRGWLTRGSRGAYGIDGSELYECPAFTLMVKDTVGAGDAFFAVAGLYAATGADVELSMFMGNIAGALGTNIIGNKEAVEKINVLKYANTLLNI